MSIRLGVQYISDFVLDLKFQNGKQPWKLEICLKNNRMYLRYLLLQKDDEISILRFVSTRLSYWERDLDDALALLITHHIRDSKVASVNLRKINYFLEVLILCSKINQTILKSNKLSSFPRSNSIRLERHFVLRINFDFPLTNPSPSPKSQAQSQTRI